MSDADQAVIARLIDACAEAITSHTDELSDLDRAIGDGDHGHNMARGFAELTAKRDELSAMAPDEALRSAGLTLVMKVGGASGPLYGSALVAMGKSDPDALSRIEAAFEAVKARGKSDVGAKTMLDVLGPIAAAVRDGKPYAELPAIADAALESTRDMLATKGRASFLGERSIGHLDPGARSTTLLVHAVCQVLNEDSA